ncbi:MAG: DoxX family protein [Gemmatimonadota bacterium]
MPRPHKPETGLFILRIALGLVFFLHGWSKLFGHQISFIKEMLTMAGWTLPDGLLWFVAVLELLGGLALLLGFFTRTAALLLVLEMLVAVILFHVRQGFFIVAIPNAPLAYGFEFHVALIGGLLCTMLGGPGRWTLEIKLAERRGETADEL